MNAPGHWRCVRGETIPADNRARTFLAENGGILPVGYYYELVHSEWRDPPPKHKRTPTHDFVDGMRERLK